MHSCMYCALSTMYNNTITYPPLSVMAAEFVIFVPHSLYSFHTKRVV